MKSRKIIILFIISFILCIWSLQAQQRYPTLIRTSLEDEIIILTVEKPVYYPGDTVRIKVQRNDSSTTTLATPILIIEGTTLTSTDHKIFSGVIPQTCPPGNYRVRLRIKDAQGRRYIYATDCVISVEEHQVIERIGRYVSIEPEEGSENIDSAMTLERQQMRNLKVIFQRDSIRLGMGPQFVTITTSVILRDGTTAQTVERRVLTFRSDQDPNRDHAMLIQYRAAYGAYAAIRPEEFSQVQIKLDSLPDWAIIKIVIEPDYSIKIGGYDPSNSYTRYFRTRGPTIETGFSLGIPKVLYDTRADDPLEYGNTSAMIRFYYVDRLTGDRFPVNLGVGTFGVSSPIDVGVGRGGFVLSILLNVAEVTKSIGIDFGRKITAGLELTPFFPLRKKARFLINAQVGFSL